jgi:hypothetical protein
MNSNLALALLVALVTLANFSPAQEAPSGAASKPEPSVAGLPKPLAAWPALSTADRERALTLTGQFKKEDEALRSSARDELVKMGAAATPILFQKVGDAEKELALNEQLYPVFDATLTAEHRGLMAEQAKKKKLELRKYLLRRLCLMADPAMKATFEPYRNDADETVKLHANLGLAAIKDGEALLVVLEMTRKAWADHVDLVKQALPPARSSECAAVVWDFMQKENHETKAAGLRLLRYVATEKEKSAIQGLLTSEDHGVVKEAINALRVIHGMEPLEKLSAFDAIGMAKEWQSK